MRVISQDGTMDVPYEVSSLNMVVGKYEDVVNAAIYCCNSFSTIRMAEYGSEEKAKKAMEMLRDAYIGTPIVMRNVDVSEDVAREFERLKKCGIMVRTENQPSKIECISNAIFQFPAEEELE